MTIPWVYVEAGVFLGACCLVGCVGGLIVTGLRVIWEARHGC